MENLTVDIDSIIPHPMNPNRMPPELYLKLRNNIRDTGTYPSLVVRSLGASHRFNAPGKLQLIDGEHRWRICKELGHETVNVENWGDVDDDMALRLLTTLNRLRGRDDARKRSTLLSLLSHHMGTQALADYVPETVEEIRRKVEIIESADVVRDADEVASDFDTFVLMVDDKLARTINAAISLRHTHGNLPGQKLDPTEFATVYHAYEKARALAAICEDYILRNVGGAR